MTESSKDPLIHRVPPQGPFLFSAVQVFGPVKASPAPSRRPAAVLS